MIEPRPIAMIPARMGSQRLKQKNLRALDGIPLITRAIRKSREAGIFSEIWVNSEHHLFKKIALQEGVKFHQRPPELAGNEATSEDFVYEFLKLHECEFLFQVHSIAPLLTTNAVVDFVNTMITGQFDVLLSAVNEQIECAIKDKPINFNFNTKTNSQKLEPIQRITWSITGWRRTTYLEAYETGRCATYSGKVGFYSIDRLAGHVIKTEEDLQIADVLLQLKKRG